MGRRHATLLDEVEADVVSGAPLADALRKVLILGGQSGSAALRDWVVRELRGYEPDDELPAYRVVGAPICVDAVVPGAIVTGQRVSVMELPEFARDVVAEQVDVTFPVAELEMMVASAQARGDSTVRLSPAGAADLVLLWNHESQVASQRIVAVYWDVPVVGLVGVLDQARTTVAELVAELRAGTPQGQGVPASDVADRAVSVAVYGRGARVVVSSQIAGGDAIAAVGVPGSEDPGWWTPVRTVWAGAVGAATIAAAVLAYLALPR